MSSLNQHITDYLEYYCNLSHPPKFGLLIKGEWGSGKTYFVKQYIENKKSSKNFKPLYISLYGVASLSEVDELIFKELHPVLSSKIVKLGSKILTNSLRAAIKIDLNSDEKNETLNIQVPDIKLPEYLKNTKDCLLIFDDLERCNIEITNLLGYINYFIEQDDLKVIVIAHENEILEKTGYKKTKEKIIGKTFSVGTDFNGALENYISEIIQDNNIKSFLNKISDLIKEFFHKANCQNLRILRQVILDFERIYKSLPPQALEKEELIYDLLKILMCLSLETKRNRISEKDIIHLLEAFSKQQVRKYYQQQGRDLQEEKFKELRNFEKLDFIFDTYPDW